MKRNLITILFLLGVVACSNSQQVENAKYNAIHKVWKFKKDVSYNDTNVILHFRVVK